MLWPYPLNAITMAIVCSSARGVGQTCTYAMELIIWKIADRLHMMSELQAC